MTTEEEIPRRSKYWRMKVDWAFEIGDARITLVESTRKGRASLRIQAPDSMRFKAFPLPPAPEIAPSEPVEGSYDDNRDAQLRGQHELIPPGINSPTASARVPLSEMDFGEWRRLTRGAA